MKTLIISDSAIHRDPRVLNQIRWLVDAGWQVDTLGVGGKPAESNGTHYELGKRALTLRAASYLFLQGRARFRFGTEQLIPRELNDTLSSYDLLVVNETELLPWVIQRLEFLPAGVQRPRVHLDLHEFSFSESTAFVYRLLFARYRTWLAGFIDHPVFESRSTVAPGIAALYSDHLGVGAPAVIMSCPQFVDQLPSEVDPNRIVLVHHGNADLDKGLGLIIEALPLVDDRYGLELMLVGNDRALAHIRKLIDAAGVSSRVQFREPVRVQEVSRAIQDCDLEIIIFTPKNENLRMALPNKFFEAVQGRLGVITGPSPSMVELENDYGFGRALPDWGVSSLIALLNELSTDAIRSMKAAAHSAAQELNAQSEGKRFTAMIDALMTRPRKETSS